jgi:hypothetical protein
LPGTVIICFPENPYEATLDQHLPAGWRPKRN